MCVCVCVSKLFAKHHPKNLPVRFLVQRCGVLLSNQITCDSSFTTCSVFNSKKVFCLSAMRQQETPSSHFAKMKTWRIQIEYPLVIVHLVIVSVCLHEDKYVSPYRSE